MVPAFSLQPFVAAVLSLRSSFVVLRNDFTETRLSANVASILRLMRIVGKALETLVCPVEEACSCC